MNRTWTTAVTLLALTTGPAFGQAKKAAARPPRNAPADTNANTGGLAGLSDDALLSELASRQMPGLLDHAFSVNKVSESQRAAMLALPAIKRLSDAENPPKPHERMQLINQIAAGADRVVASISDPSELMLQSKKLVEFAVEPDTNLMEYWGETPQVQKRLAPVIGTVMKMLDKAVTTATAQRAQYEEQLNDGANTKAEKLWTDADALVTTAEYTRAILRYNEALTISADAKGIEQRTKIANPAIEYLQAYDNAESGVQTFVRNRLAKLNMVKRDFGPANDLFETVVSGQVEKTKIEPAPTPVEQYEARYFGIVCELMQGDIARAQAGLKELIDWQQKAVPDPKAQEGLIAAAEMLRYRIAMKERDKAKDPAGKKAAEEKAFGVLMNLYETQPQFRSTIAEQLIEAIGDKVDVKTAEVLILQALVNRGIQVRDAIDDPATADRAIVGQVELAIAAAKELMARKDPKITPDAVSNAAIQLPLFYEKIGKKVEAANSYLDYIEKKQGSEKNIKAAFDRAGYLLFTLTKDGAGKDDPAISTAWERFLPIAVNNFGLKEFAFDYANRLRAKNPPQHAEAIKFFRMVPENDKRIAAARFREMITLTDWIYAVGPDKKPLLNPQERAAKVQETLKVAEEVNTLAAAALKVSKDKAEGAMLRSRIAIVTLTQAELAASGEKPDWQRVLKTLTGFEKRSAGVDNEAALNKKVMELRVASYMQLKQFNKAADELIALLKREPGGRAEGMVLGILQRLEDDYDRSVAEKDAAAAKQVLSNRADLSGFLVKWASESKDPNITKNLYVYKVYDADSQRLYGTVLEGAERKAQLEKAMAAFEALRQPNEVAAFKAMVEDRKKENPNLKINPDEPDPGVALGMAKTSYDLGDWKTAATELKRLRSAGRLGARSIPQNDPKTGETKIVPNEQYWEAMAKYYTSTQKWAAAEPENGDAQKELEAVKTLLRRDYVAGVDDVGGTKWRESFGTLRKELVPDLDVEQLRKASPATQPTPEPVANRTAE
jgi:tetratricopeptide (TPR) repeat protein